jgi:hydroxymethylpyrimidine/phosphomethylpyrimidine kinase
LGGLLNCPIISGMTIQDVSLASSPDATSRYVRVLSIAGSDSGGGAGIQADLKTFSALGCYGMTAITAITAQNTVGVSAIHGVPPEILKAQIQAVVEDIGVDAVKIGMLHSPEMVKVVAWAIDHYQLRRVVLDPVMVATSGDRLIAQETVQVLVRELFPRAAVITPNLDEAALLLGRDIHRVEQLDQAAGDLLAMGAQAVLLKGGHLTGEQVVDVLAQPGLARQRLQSARIASRNVHGTGCTLSSAIASYLALGLPLPQAVEQARAYILQAIATGAQVKTGQGHGPLNHGHAPVPMRLVPVAA